MIHVAAAAAPRLRLRGTSPAQAADFEASRALDASLGGADARDDVRRWVRRVEDLAKRRAGLKPKKRGELDAKLLSAVSAPETFGLADLADLAPSPLDSQAAHLGKSPNAGKVRSSRVGSVARSCPTPRAGAGDPSADERAVAATSLERAILRTSLSAAPPRPVLGISTRPPAAAAPRPVPDETAAAKTRRRRRSKRQRP